MREVGARRKASGPSQYLVLALSMGVLKIKGISHRGESHDICGVCCDYTRDQGERGGFEARQPAWQLRVGARGVIATSPPNENTSHHQFCSESPLDLSFSWYRANCHPGLLRTTSGNTTLSLGKPWNSKLLSPLSKQSRTIK
jgi:hypothetical protein